MMRPTKLQIRNFRGWSSPVEVNLDRPVTLIVGDNQRGKSSTLNAMEWCLFGPDVEKKSSGIIERIDWATAHRDAPDQPVEVAVTLSSNDGDYRIVRRRHPNKKIDEHFVETPNGERLEGEALADWRRSSSLPDWETWRRAYCQHQEAARARVLDSGDRSAVLGSLLGLDDDLRLQSALEIRGAISGLDNSLSRVEKDLIAEIERPRRDVDELKDRIVHKGIPKDSITPTLPGEVARELLIDAKRLGSELNIHDVAAQVDIADLHSVARWAAEWPGEARSKDGTEGRISALREQRRRLATALAEVEPLEEERRRGAAALAQEVFERGDAASRKSALDLATKSSTAVTKQLTDASARRSLLRNALQVHKAMPGEGCPVCGHSDTDLEARLQREISALETTEISRLESAQDDAREAVESAKAAVTALEDATKRVEVAEAKLSKALPSLRLLMEIEPGDDSDALAKARLAIEAFDNDIRSLEESLSRRDQSLNRFTPRADLLRELIQLAEAQRRLEARVDVTALPSWGDLQLAIDDAAELAADREAIAGMVRAALADRSRRRANEANAALGAYAEAITGWSGLTIEVHSTPKRVSYEIVDDTNRNALPVLNQAALNALSIALLLAQAEQQANVGRPAWVVLDDPIQSLDAAHQKGLAAALDRLAHHCPVFAAVTPSDLVERTEKFVSQRRRIVWLKPGARNVPLAVDRVEEL